MDIKRPRLAAVYNALFLLTSFQYFQEKYLVLIFEDFQCYPILSSNPLRKRPHSSAMRKTWNSLFSVEEEFHQHRRKCHVR